MPHAKPDPKRYCRACAARLIRKRINGRLEDFTVFTRRIYCDRACMAVGHTKETVSKSAHHYRARRHRKPACEGCGVVAEGLHVHHRDHDFRNGAPENLITLCGTCHLKLHWATGEHVPKRYYVRADSLGDLLEAIDEALPRLPKRLQARIKVATTTLHAKPK